MATQPGHLHRLLPLFDPLLGRAPLVVEPYHRPARRLLIGHDEPDAREQLSGMTFDLRHHSPRRRPTGGLVEKALVPHGRFVAGTPSRARQQFRHIPFQVLIGRNADSVLHAPAFERFVNLRLGEAGVGAKHNFLAQFLLPLNLRQQKFFPAIGTVNIAGTELGRQAVAVPAE